VEHHGLHVCSTSRLATSEATAFMSDFRGRVKQRGVRSSSTRATGEGTISSHFGAPSSTVTAFDSGLNV
jgi:hypothetical protein